MIKNLLLPNLIKTVVPSKHNQKCTTSKPNQKVIPSTPNLIKKAPSKQDFNKVHMVKRRVKTCHGEKFNLV